MGGEHELVLKVTNLNHYVLEEHYYTWVGGVVSTQQCNLVSVQSINTGGAEF